MQEKDVKNNESIDLSEVHGGNFLSSKDITVVKEFVKDTTESSWNYIKGVIVYERKRCKK